MDSLQYLTHNSREDCVQGFQSTPDKTVAVENKKEKFTSEDIGHHFFKHNCPISTLNELRFSCVTIFGYSSAILGNIWEKDWKTLALPSDNFWSKPFSISTTVSQK